MTLTDLLNNAWVVGIGGGVASGFFVTYASGWLLSRRERREYYQKVSSANRDVIYALRPSVPEEAIPSTELIRALINATARRYSVERKDVYDVPEIAEELIKEVIDSSFISAKTKEQYCKELGNLAQPVLTSLATTKPETRAPEDKKVNSTGSNEYRLRMTQTMSMMLGLVTAMMTLLITVIQPSLTHDIKSPAIGLHFTSFPKETFSLFVPTVLAMLSVVIVMGMMPMILLTRDIQRRKSSLAEGSKSSPVKQDLKAPR